MVRLLYQYEEEMTGDKIVTRILITVAVLCSIFLAYSSGYDNGVVKGWGDEAAFDRCVHEQPIDADPIQTILECPKPK